MAKTGSIDKKLYAASFKISVGRTTHNQQGNEAKGLKLFREGMSKALNAFRDAKATNDILVLINTESVFAYQEYCLCDKSNKQAVASFKQGFQDMLDARGVSTLSDNELKVSDKVISSKDIDRVDGSPKDAFHKCCSSQITRLNNSLKSNMASPAERELIHQRIDNLKHAKELHLEKQASLMPKRSRGKEIGE